MAGEEQVNADSQIAAAFLHGLKTQGLMKLTARVELADRHLNVVPRSSPSKD